MFSSETKVLLNEKVYTVLNLYLIELCIAAYFKC